MVSVLVTLGVVAGGLALDRTVLHWYSEESNESSASVVLSETAHPTPSGPTRTAPEISQALRTQTPTWCRNELQGVIESAGLPQWDQAQRTWVLSCVIITRDDSSDELFVTTFCTLVDDVTLEVTAGGNSTQIGFTGC